MNLSLTHARLWHFLAIAVLLAACAAAPAADLPGASATAPLPRAALTATPRPQVLALPAPQLKGRLTLEEALALRRSVRDFSDTPLTPAELGQLLWAAQGITHPPGRRTAPSAGALYPLEVYVVTREGVYHYEPEQHRLAVQAAGDVRRALFEAALRQEAVSEAPAVIAIAAVYARTAQKYGDPASGAGERSSRYVHLEAGHAAQNILLQAVALGLGAVPVGAFRDEEVKRALALPPDQQPLYLIPVGHPG
jgi:SagB-type dehydrogenase family enzyme